MSQPEAPQARYHSRSFLLPLSLRPYLRGFHRYLIRITGLHVTRSQALTALIEEHRELLGFGDVKEAAQEATKEAQ
jgi:hypothetical protein